MGDELFDVRCSYLVGNFHQTIAEGANARTVLKKPEDVSFFNSDRDGLVAKAQLGLGRFEAVIADLRTSTTPSLVGIRYFAECLRDHHSNGSAFSAANPSFVKLLEHCQLDVASAAAATPLTWAKAEGACLAAAVYLLLKDYTSALKLLSQFLAVLGSAAAATNNAQQTAQDNYRQRVVLELRALAADVYLRVQRVDLADKEVAQMKQLDDEATITILTNGIVCLRQAAATGKKEKYDEATHNFSEVASRCGPSSLTFCLLSIANMGRGQLQDAERNLLDATAKKSGDPDVATLMAAVAGQQGKALEQVMRLRSGAPLTAMEDRFRDACVSFGSS